MATMLDFAGVKGPKERALDGVSLRPVLLGGGSLGQRQFFWKGQAMRDGQWKYVASPKGGGLFNLKDDLAESTNLAKRHPDRAIRMAAKLETWKLDVAANATPQPGYVAAKAGK
jgi:arylsulfatase A